MQQSPVSVRNALHQRNVNVSVRNASTLYVLLCKASLAQSFLNCKCYYLVTSTVGNMEGLDVFIDTIAVSSCHHSISCPLSNQFESTD